MESACGKESRAFDLLPCFLFVQLAKGVTFVSRCESSSGSTEVYGSRVITYSLAQCQPFDLLVFPFWNPILVKVPKGDHLLFPGLLGK